MKIEIKRSLEGAKSAKGLAVVIDVIRASTTICTLISKKVDKIIIARSSDDALRLKRDNPGYLVIGEKDGIRPEGFDYNNSPRDIDHLDLEGKKIIFSTTNGTKMIANIKKADQVIVACFNNMGSIVEYIKTKGPGVVSLIAAGSSGKDVPEDMIFAQCLKSRLENKEYDINNLKEKVMEGASAKVLKLLDSLDEIGYCLKMDRSKVVPILAEEGYNLVIKDAC